MSASLRVLSWNLWWRFGDWQRRHTAIETALANAQPDLVGLQEVWTADDVNQAELLARHLGMCWALAPSPSPGRWQRRIGDDRFGFANAVLSRWPLTREETVVLPAPAGHPPERTLLCTEARTPRGPVPFFTTQLDSAPDGSATRVAQVTEVVRRLAAWPAVGYPPVLTGDLNAEPDSDELRLLGGHKTAPAVPGMVLLDAWLYADPQDRGLTWHLDNPHAAAQGPVSARIDYVMTGIPAGDGRGRVQGVAMVGDRPVGGVWPSDHAGVVADLQG